jgi:hypothetical protein
MGCRLLSGMTRERDKMKKRKMKEFVTSPANLVASIDDEEFKDTEVRGSYAIFKIRLNSYHHRSLK